MQLILEKPFVPEPDFALSKEGRKQGNEGRMEEETKEGGRRKLNESIYDYKSIYLCVYKSAHL